MTVTALWVPVGPGGRELALGGIGYAPVGALRESGLAEGAPVDQTNPTLQALLQAATLCTDAALLPPGSGRAGWTVLGDPSEGALLVAAAKAGIDLAASRQAAPREAELPFDADTKLMATRHRRTGAPRQVLIKGGVHLENLGSLNVVAFDKTGTLTEGRFKLTDIIAVNGASTDELLSVAAAVEQPSSHPLAVAVVRARQEQELHVHAAHGLEHNSRSGGESKGSVRASKDTFVTTSRGRTDKRC
mgnify:CR=1 FL=1